MALHFTGRRVACSRSHLHSLNCHAPAPVCSKTVSENALSCIQQLGRLPANSSPLRKHWLGALALHPLLSDISILRTVSELYSPPPQVTACSTTEAQGSCATRTPCSGRVSTTTPAPSPRCRRRSEASGCPASPCRTISRRQSATRYLSVRVSCQHLQLPLLRQC